MTDTALEKMRTIRASDIRQIEGILDFVHDRTFQLDLLSFEREVGILAIPLTVIADLKIKEQRTLFVKTWRCPVVKAILRIKRALTMEVLDEAKIGEGAINTISLEKDHVVIKCGVPVEIRVRVSALDVELELSDTVVEEVKRFALF